AARARSAAQKHPPVPTTAPAPRQNLLPRLRTVQHPPTPAAPSRRSGCMTMRLTWLRERSLMPLSGACRLADLHQVAIGVAQKAADLRAPVARRGEENRSTRPHGVLDGGA